MEGGKDGSKYDEWMVKKLEHYVINGFRWFLWAVKGNAEKNKEQ